MRIDSTNLGMESENRYFTYAEKKTAFAIRDYQYGLGNESERETLNNENESPLSIYEKLNSEKLGKARDIKAFTGEDLKETFRQRVIQYIYDCLFSHGKKKPVEDFDSDYGFSTDTSAGQNRIYLETQETVHEFQSMSFSSKGTVKTSDGRTIDFNIDVAVSRELYYSRKSEIDMTSLMYGDPLVINLDCDSADVSDLQILFDIDSDGKEEKINLLSEKSAFLAFDRNGDGIINDGSELFGAKSGDGFYDLAEFDEDHNGWIDEGDTIYDKLSCVVFDKDGKQHSYLLKDKNIGAINVSGATTDFAIKHGMEANAYIKKTGIFLYENGNVGTLQQVDVGIEKAV